MHRVVIPVVIIALSFCNAVHAAVVTIEGTIKSIDATKRTITVQTGSESKSLDVSSKAKINVEGKDASLDTLKVGQKVKLSYHDDLEIVLKIDGAATNGPASADSIQSDIKLLSGHWITVAEETNGQATAKNELKTVNRRLEIKGNRITMSRVMGGQLGKYEGKIDINPTTKPKEFDFIGKGPRGALVEWKGIYEVNDKTLKLYYRYVKRPETKRPGAFKTSAAQVEGEAFVGITCQREAD